MAHLYQKLSILIVMLVLSAGSSLAFSKQGDLQQGLKVAHSGYDVVSYFTVGKAEQGNTQFTAIYKDTVYQFASSDHQAIF